MIEGSNLLHKIVCGALPSGGEDASRSERVTRDLALLDQTLEALLDRFELIAKLDELWNADVTFGRLAYDPADDAELSGLYRDWLAGAEVVASELSARQGEGVLPHSERFLTRLEDARGICTPDEIFFSGPKLEALEAQALAAYHAGETEEFTVMGE